MMPHTQSNIDTYSNIILNNLLLAENLTGINIIHLAATPTVQTLPTLDDGILYPHLDYLFKDHTPIELGKVLLSEEEELSFYFMCASTTLHAKNSDVLYNSYYQLTGDDFLIMTFYHHNQPIETSKLDVSSLITCSLNLNLYKDYELYKQIAPIIRQMVIRFYVPQLHTTHMALKPLPNNKTSEIDETLHAAAPESLLSSDELNALEKIFNQPKEKAST